MLRISVLLCLCFVSITASHAQMLPDLNVDEAPSVNVEALSPEQVQAMVARLSDQEVRALLLQRLDAIAQANMNAGLHEDSGLTVFFNHATEGAMMSIWTAIVRVPDLWKNQSRSFKNFHDKLGAEGLMTWLGAMFGAIAIGLIAMVVINRASANWQGAAKSGEMPDSLAQTLRFLFRRLFTDVIGIVVFLLITRVLVAYWLEPELENFARVLLVNMVAFPLMLYCILRFLMAPNRPEMRLVHVDDAHARYMVRNFSLMMVLLGFSVAIVDFNQLNGVSMGESRLGFWLNLAVQGFTVYVVWRARYGIRIMMRGADPDITPMEAKFAHAYPVALITFTVLTWYLVNILVSYELFALLQSGPHHQMIILCGFAPVMDTMVRALVRRLMPPITGEGPLAEAAYRSARRSYIRIGRVVVASIVVLTIADIWQIDLANLAAAGVGAQLAGRLLEILMVVAAGYLIWELVTLWINRKLAAEMTAAGVEPNDEEAVGGEGGGAGGSRLSTVLPLLLGVIRTAIVVIFSLLALGNVGVDITPLLAGAGIVGLAVGFGAQKLVTDVVSGIFFLVDDAFRTGEYIEVEGTVGTVEKISIRSMQLRHHKGPVNTIPYGEIPKITNYSRDWVIMKLKFTVPFDTDPNKVKKIFKQIGQELAQVPEFAQDMLQPFKSQGVFDFDDVGMIICGKFMAKPGKQFTLRKEIYNRVKKAFADNGIDFARREVRVAIPGLEGTNEISESQKTAIAGAAGQVAQQVQAEADQASDTPRADRA